MSPVGISSVSTAAAAAVRPSEKIRDAASQFEALLIGQMLHAAHEGPSEDPASDCATDFAEQHLATTMAKAGGLGIADLIARGLK